MSTDGEHLGENTVTPTMHLPFSLCTLGQQSTMDLPVRNKPWVSHWLPVYHLHVQWAHHRWGEECLRLRDHPKESEKGPDKDTCSLFLQHNPNHWVSQKFQSGCWTLCDVSSSHRNMKTKALRDWEMGSERTSFETRSSGTNACLSSHNTPRATFHMPCCNPGAASLTPETEILATSSHKMWEPSFSK